MRMEALLAILVSSIVSLATSTHAQTVTIRSGDHAQFVRLVLAIPSGQAWEIGRSDDGYLLDLGNPEIGFDTFGVFARIPRNRISGLEEESGRLAITLNCLCFLRAYLWRTDRLVIDVVDGPAPEGARFEARLEREPPPPLPVRLPLGQRRISEFPAEHPQPPPMVLPDPFAASLERQNGVAEAEQSLLQNLARAASQGLLDVAQPEASSTVPTELSERVVPAPVNDGSPVPVIHDGLASDDASTVSVTPGLVMQTSIDREGVWTMTALPTTQDGIECFDDRWFDVDAWGDDRPFQLQIADRNAALAADIDVPTQEAVEALARNYIYFGFGREALQALVMDGARSQYRDILAVLARIIDDEPVSVDILDHQLGCMTPVMLWRALARDSIGGTKEPERTAIISAYRALPVGLRGHLGPRLARLFSDTGDADTAANLLVWLEPADTADRAATGVAQAEVALQTDGADRAIDRLQTLAAEEARLSPEAVLRLMDLSLADGRDIQPEVLTLASAMRYENRNYVISSDLAVAEVRSLLAVDRFADAFALVDGEVGPMAPDARIELRSEIVVNLVRRMPDAAFLRFTFEALPQDITAEAENAVAARLIEMGFIERAAQLVLAPARGEDQAERRYLRAEIALGMGNFPGFEALLVGIDTARAAQLRARSFAAQGDFVASLSQMQADATDVPDLAYWRAGAWAALGDQDDPLLRAASAAILRETETMNDDLSLTERHELLEKSVATRELASELLARFGFENLENATLLD